MDRNDRDRSTTRQDTYENEVLILEDVLREIPTNLIVADKFDTLAVKCVMKKTNKRERLLLELT